MINKKNSGFSLIEVMIGLVISLVIVLGILQIFIGSKRSYSLGNNYSSLQEQSRFAVNYINKFVRLAGYRTIPDATLYTSIDDIFTSTNPYISVQDNSGTNNSDILTIRYQGSGDGLGTPDGTIVDCLNQGVDSNSIVTLIFSITANNELQCRSQNPSATNTDSTQIIMNNVENLQVMLGEDLNDDKSPERFVAPNHPNLNINRVIAVRIGLLLRSDDAVNLNNNTTTYDLLGNQITVAQDNFLRIPVTSTMQLRNLIFEVL
jgi:type IV pilus assembly protein PilW